MKDLDRAEVPLESTLEPTAREVLKMIRGRGRNIRTWVEAYNSTSVVKVLPKDGSAARARPCTLRRLVTKTLMNIERTAKAEFKAATGDS